MVKIRVDEDYRKFLDRYRADLKEALNLDIIPSRTKATKILANTEIEITIKKRNGSKKLKV